MNFPFEFSQEQEYKIFEDKFGNTVFQFKESGIELIAGDMIHISVLAHSKITKIKAVNDEYLLNYSLKKHYGKIPEKNFFSVLYLSDKNNNTTIKIVADEIILTESHSKSILEIR